MKVRSFDGADESLQIFKRSVTVDPGPDGTGGGSLPSGLGFNRTGDRCVEFVPRWRPGPNTLAGVQPTLVEV